MKQQKKYELDTRTSKDIKKQIELLAKSYTPEWNFDKDNPDVGAVIAFLFADQMEENAKRYNELLEVYHADLVNMIGLSLMPAQSAGTSVVMNLVASTIPGSYVPRGTKLLGDADEGNVIFETSHPLYVTSSTIKDIFMTGEAEGKIIPLFGGLKEKPLVEFGEKEEEEEEEEEFGETFTDASVHVNPFKLFDFDTEGIEKNALILYHTDCFDIQDEKIYMRLKGADDFAKRILEGDFRISYLTEEGLVPVDEVSVKDDIIILKKSEECAKINIDKPESVMVIEAATPITDRIEIEDIDFSSNGDPQPLQAAGNGNTDFDVNEFKPFTEALSLYASCYLYHDEYFSRAGSKVTLKFSLEFGTRMAVLPQAQVEDSLKIIKRRPKNRNSETVVDAYIDEVSIEYFTENGWKRLPLDQDASRIFASVKNGPVELTFTVPSDWIGIEGGQRAIRIQSIKADNCYMMPSAQHYPIIHNMTVSYSYEGKFLHPDRVEAVYGTIKKDITRDLLQGRGITAFAKSRYTDNALYIGFNKKLEAGPISMLFVMEEETHFVGENLRFEYSTLDGFKHLQVVDKTETFARTGIIRFIPPEDMAMTTIEDIKRYWIRIVDVDKKFSNEKIYRPTIKQLFLNAVDVFNIDTHDTEDFFIDAVTANMSIDISASNILDADVWVNEITSHKLAEMKEMLREHSGDCYAEYDTQGNIIEFFVKWKEVNSFMGSKPGDRHYVLDRMEHKIFFGDGVHVNIPRVTSGTAIRVVARSCNGAEANVEAGAIEESFGTINYIGGLTNPFPAFGGGNTETIDNALSRAAGILGNRRRLVTLRDYENEVLTFSDNIDKVRIVIGESVNGETDDGMISLVILMKDFGLGTHSFDRLLPELKKHLDECTEMTAGTSQIEIVEPIAVSLSVDIWLDEMDTENEYEIHEKLVNALNDYLSPVSDGLHSGWEIGMVPSRTQIMMKLNSLKTGAFIRRLVITGSYSDTEGTHECDLEELPRNKFFVVRSGEHKAHILKEGLK